MLTDGQAVLLHAEIGPPARFDAIGQRCVQLPLQIALIVLTGADAPSGDSGFTFVDLENVKATRPERTREREGLTLFLERSYIASVIAALGADFRLPSQAVKVLRSRLALGNIDRVPGPGECLLSAFDSNKKILYALVDGRIVGRAFPGVRAEHKHGIQRIGLAFRQLDKQTFDFLFRFRSHTLSTP